MAKSGLVDLTLTYRHQTDAAFKLSKATGEPVWLPKSVAEIYPEDLLDGATVEVTIPESWALEKGLIWPPAKP